MGIVAGTLFWQTENTNSIISIIFQSMFYSALAQMTLITKQFPFRSIFYKQQDANFFPTWSYVIGRSIATIPIACTDALGYGTAIYFFVGLAAPYNGADSIANFFVFLLLVFEISLTTGLFFSMYSASVKVVTISQACMALTGKHLEFLFLEPLKTCSKFICLSPHAQLSCSFCSRASLFNRM